MFGSRLRDKRIRSQTSTSRVASLSKAGSSTGTTSPLNPWIVTFCPSRSASRLLEDALLGNPTKLTSAVPPPNPNRHPSKHVPVAPDAGVTTSVAVASLPSRFTDRTTSPLGRVEGTFITNAPPAVSAKSSVTDTAAPAKVTLNADAEATGPKPVVSTRTDVAVPLTMEAGSTLRIATSGRNDSTAIATERFDGKRPSGAESGERTQAI
eukprot:2460679-Rhodomonas_salina.5